MNTTSMLSNEGDLSEELENMPVTDTCNGIRRKIRALIDSNEMKVGEFQNAIKVTPNAYTRFMSQNGADNGMGSSVYMAAWAFFKKRELRGVKLPSTRAKKGEKESVPSVDDIELPGEMDDAVPVYDTCDDVRRKINAHLKKPGVTAASFLRHVAAQYHTVQKKPQSTQLSAFRSKKGPYAGNTSAIFYGAYVYFEKLRIKEGKPKGKKRQEMEDVHASHGGVETKHRLDRFLCGPNERPTVDGMGRFEFVKKG